MLKIRQISKQYVGRSERLIVVDKVSLDITQGAFVTLLGPSGCGKTTTLRMIAGLETPSSGVIEIDGEPIYSSETKLNVAVSQRPIAMVFQSYAIWPHMNVLQNVAFPLQSKKFRLSRAEIKERAEEALFTVGLHNQMTRDPAALSGGQQQRVALARALVSRPKVLLLDEPLSNLDVKLRDEMRDKIKELHDKTKLTTIFVTHDQNEAMALSSHIVIMNAGKVVETGSPQNIFENPKTRFAASFVGKYNIFEGKIADAGGDRLCIVVTKGGGIINARMSGHADMPTAGCHVLAYIRPSSIILEKAEDQSTGLLGVVHSAVYLGGHWEVKVVLRNGDIVLIHLSLANARRVDLLALSQVRLVPDADEVVIVTDQEAISHDIAN
jgi:iron(III) transport system ATP-binding protein